MRMVVGTALMYRGVNGISSGPAIAPLMLIIFQMILGVLLVIGLWTPVAGTLVAGFEIWRLFSQPGDPWIHIFLATLGIALALLGPGAWSVDARLFGWRRIDIPRQSHH
jgi:uncharacterized membrane protein YphA (DoxX/SURF4 family)